MVTQPEQPVDITPVPEDEPVVEEVVKVETEEEVKFQPPLSGQEFRATVTDGYEYVKDAWLQPFRKVVREGLDATRAFAHDLSGRQRKK